MFHNTLLASLSGEDFVSIGHLFRDYASNPVALRYEPATHSVLQACHFHTGELSVWRYSAIPLPDTVGTVGELVAHLAHNNELEPLPELKLFWVERQQYLTLYKDKVTVGRYPHRDLRFEDADWFAKLSRQHCVFFHKNGQWYLMDSGSSNHTWLNQFPLKSELPVALHRGDRISFCRNGDSFVFDHVHL